jgi:SnoaL-like domain
MPASLVGPIGAAILQEAVADPPDGGRGFGSPPGHGCRRALAIWPSMMRLGRPSATAASGSATMATTSDVVATYVAAWNAADPTERRRLVEDSLAEDGVLIEPRGSFEGREAVLERIGGFPERLPGGRVLVTSGVDEHHGFARYAWTVLRADGSTFHDGIDFAEVGGDGRLRRVIMFFGPLQAVQ